MQNLRGCTIGTVAVRIVNKRQMMMCRWRPCYCADQLFSSLVGMYSIVCLQISQGLQKYWRCSVKEKVLSPSHRPFACYSPAFSPKKGNSKSELLAMIVRSMHNTSSVRRGTVGRNINTCHATRGFLAAVGPFPRPDCGEARIPGGWAV